MTNDNDSVPKSAERAAGPIDAMRPEMNLHEGNLEKLPLWDGLSDELGPIPAFGPAVTDETGRVLMDDGERAARRDAAIRALAAIGKITDATDTEERWSDVFRGLEGVS